MEWIESGFPNPVRVSLQHHDRLDEFADVPKLDLAIVAGSYNQRRLVRIVVNITEVEISSHLNDFTSCLPNDSVVSG